MKTLSGLRSLEHKAVITVPTTFGLHGDADDTMNRTTVELVQEALTFYCGGTTTVSGFGTYESAYDGSIAREHVTLVIASFAELTEVIEQQLIEVCEKVKERHQQECIALEVDGKLYFV